MNGFVHSTESFGTVDGPGVRFVVFLQGCPMRCQYCHNPDTWKMNAGSVRSAQSLIREYERNAAFYRGGGITVTGGEALMQIDFVLELFRLAKEKKIHTCLDTSGVTYRPGESDYNKKLDALMEVTDLVMLDIKHIDPEGHKTLTGHDNAGILAFARYLEEKKIPVWGQRVPSHDLDKCRGCKKCQVEAACPIGAAVLVDGKLKVDTDACNRCGRCKGTCPFGVTSTYVNCYKICIGGRWGKKTAHGIPLSKLFMTEEEVLDVIERTILFFRDEGNPGERFADTINRLGIDYVESKIIK